MACQRGLRACQRGPRACQWGLRAYHRDLRACQSGLRACLDGRTYKYRNFSPFYRTLSSVGAAVQKPFKNV